jgi:hypothetical protein
MSYHAAHPQNTATAKPWEWVEGTDALPEFVEYARTGDHVTATVSVFCEPDPSSAMFMCCFTCDSPDDGILPAALSRTTSLDSGSCRYDALSVRLAAGQHLLTRKDTEVSTYYYLSSSSWYSYCHNKNQSPGIAPAVIRGKRICREKTGTDWQTVLDINQYGEEIQNRQNKTVTKEI